MFVAFLMLLHASYHDVRRRMVPDRVFFMWGGVGLTTIILSVAVGGYSFELRYILLSAAVTSSYAWAAYHLHVFGGADAKALVTLALILPTYHGTTPQIHPFTALIVLGNAAVIALPILAAAILTRRTNMRFPALPILTAGYLTMLFYGDLWTVLV